MRLRLLIVLALLLALFAFPALADAFQYGNTVYVFAGEEAAPSQAYISVEGVAYDAETLTPQAVPGLSGAVFGVYAMDAAGNPVPFADPDDPLRPYQVTTADTLTAVKLPGGVDLYLRQESAPDGYAVDGEEPAYRPLVKGETLFFTNHQTGRQGLALTLTGWGDAEETPLAGVRFVLEGMGKTHTLTTDREGRAALSGIAPGRYMLGQIDAVKGYQVDTPVVSVDIAAEVPIRLALTNSRDGALFLRTLGLSMDVQGQARLVPIARRYTVTDADGRSMGEIGAGETLSLPAASAGTGYVVRAAEAGADGFATDEAAHAVVVYPGQTATLQTVVQDMRGTFELLHIDAADGSPVAGGIFSLRNEAGETVLTFEADANGGFAPEAPLPSGHYTLHMVHTAAGYIYADTAVAVEISSAFASPQAPVIVTFASPALPDSLFEPTVRTQTASLRSLFDQDAVVDFTLTAFSGDEPVTIGDVQYTFTLPAIEGLSVQRRRSDGASVRIARRVALEGVEEVTALAVEGEISYVFAYRVDAEGGSQTVEVLSPFSVVAATFAGSTRVTPYAVSGHIYDETGAPVVGLKVTLDTLETVTDPFGAYAFGAGAPGAAPAFSVPEGYGVQARGTDYWILPLRTVTGTVIAEGGLTGYPVTVAMGGEEPVSPDETGGFTLSGPFAATEPLLVETPEGILAVVEESGSAPVITLYPAAAIAGQAVDPEDAPVEGVTVLLEGEGVALSMATGSDGAFAMDGLFPGTYTLTFEAPAEHVLSGEKSLDIALAAGEQRSDVRVVALRATAIEGRLLDGDAPYPGVRVRLSPSGREAVTDEAGRFAFEGLGLDAYEITFALPEDIVLLDAPEAIVLALPGQREAVTVHAVRPAGLSGRIWYDANDDGYLSSEEAGLAGTAIALLDAQAKQVAALETDGDGQFAFEGLVPGVYRLVVTLPQNMIFAREAPATERIAAGVDGRTAESDWLTLQSGERLEGLVAGAVEAGTVHGVLWEDVDGNGALNADEARLHGIEVSLRKDGVPLATQSTDLLGQYRFENLRPGDYTLLFTLPEGCMFTTRADSGGYAVGSDVATSDASTASHAVSLRRWRMDATVNAGMQRPVSIAAQVWLDTTAGGANPRDAGYADIAVTLLRVTDATEAIAAQAFTDAQGNVRFDGLRPGRYRIRYQLPDAGWGFTAGVAETAGIHGTTEVVTLQSGKQHAAEDVGLTKYGTVEGRAFVDADYSGLRKEGEAGLSVQVALLTASGQVLREAQTQRDGGYAFDKLPAGMYSVRFTLPDGYVFTRQRMDAPSYNSDVPETDGLVAQTDAIYLPMGETLLLDAGAYRPASLAGLVWQDLRGQGRYQYDNPPLSGLAVTLLREDEEVARMTTGADGAFRFEDIPPGE